MKKQIKNVQSTRYDVQFNSNHFFFVLRKFVKDLYFGGIVTVVFFLLTVISFSQGIGINTTGATADPSAMFDISATNKGLLIPRMTTAQRNAIVSTASGLMIYNTTTKCFEFYENATWNSMVCACTTPSAPTANAASSIAQTSFTANWTSSAGATAYYIDVATDIGFTAFVYNNVNAGAGTSYSVTGLTCATTYYYRVRANNSCGTSGSSNIITQATSSCACVPSIPVTFNYTGASTTWTVPGGVTCITIDARGAQGGGQTYSASNPTGGNGARKVCTVSVTAGQGLTIMVGGQGATGTLDGGGGGGSFVWVTSSGTLLTAAGGGGAPGSCGNGAPGVGNATSPSGSGNGGTCGSCCDNGNGVGGGGAGWLSNGWGAGPNHPGPAAAATTPLSGGAGGIQYDSGGWPNGNGGFGGGGGGGGNCGGGGGGGGYTGGDGGSNTLVCGAQGQGGTSYCSGTTISSTDGYQAGNGQIIITY